MYRYCLTLLLFLVTLLSWGDDRGRYSENSVLSTGTWVKIRVPDSGIYQLTGSDLRSMGFKSIDNVKLYGMNMEVLPENGLENLPGDLTELPLYRTGDKVLFYGRGTTKWTLTNLSNNTPQFIHFNNPYSNYTYYLLTEGENPKEFATYNYDVKESNSVSSFPSYALIEKDEYSFMNSGRTFFESYDYALGSNKSYTLDLPGVDSSSNVYLTVQFCAAGTSSSSVSVSMNSQDIGSFTIGSLAEYEAGKLGNGRYTLSNNFSESNTVRLTHTRSSGNSGHLDYIRAGYMRRLHLDGSQLLFRPSRSGDITFQLSGATEKTQVWRVTRGCDIDGVSGSLSGDVLTIPFTSESTSAITWKDEELIALDPSASFPKPQVLGRIENQDLHSLGNIDMVIVVPSSGHLVSQAQRLADVHKEYDGMECVVVRADQIYNEFSSGTPDATAIRRFMKMLYDNATSSMNRPKDLLLFGDGLWDNRMITSATKHFSSDDYLLCYESDNSLSHTDSYVLEDYFVLVDDNASSNALYAYPRIGIGRLPVHNASEAKDVVDKLVGYIQNTEVGSWKNTMCFICDDGNNNIHMQDGEAVISQTMRLFPDYNINRIYLDTYYREVTATGNRYPGAESDVNKQVRDGALIMNYTGHGSPNGMTHEKVFQRSHFDNWNSPRLPLWITAACDISPFDMNQENIGESAVLNPRGGAIGFLGTARTVYSSPNRQMNLRFMKYVLGSDALGRQYTIGEALSLGKCELISSSSSAVNRAHFVYLGDPGLKLKIPTYKVVIDDINGISSSSGSIASVGAGETVKVNGHIENVSGLLADDFDGLVYPTILDNIETVVCNNNPRGENNGNDSDEPYTFEARTRTLYTMVDSVRSGRFSFNFPIPLDNNYSGESGLISLYASMNDHSIEAHGHNEQFKITSTSTSYSDDKGPEISPVYLNVESFQSGDVVNETPLLIAYLSDESGINTTGSGIGHDITAMIDNNEQTTYSLNSYYSPTIGDYHSGSVVFSIPELEDGHHTLTVRAFDIFNNSSSSTIEFYVNNGEKPKIFSLYVNSPVHDTALFTIENDRPQSDLTVHIKVYDIAGREVYNTKETNFSSSSTYTFSWNLNETDSHLVPGVYLVKAGISTSDGPQSTEAVKFFVVR